MIMKTSLVGVGLLLLLVAMIQKSHAQSETLDTLKLYASFKRLDEIKPEIVDRLMKTKDKRHSAAPPLPLHPPPTSLGEDATPIDYVDTRIGTGGYFYDVGALGPGPQVPFGAARLGPDTSFGLEPLKIPWDHNAGYWYHDLYIEAFSQTHLVGAGSQDLGNFGVMVTRKEIDSDLITSSHYKSLYTHARETAKPGYYSVHLLDPNATAELTVSGTHSGIHRYNCTGVDQCSLLVDVCHTVLGSSAWGCRNGSLSTTLEQDHVLVSQGSILSYGHFGQSSPIGGVLVWGYLRVEAYETGTGKPVTIEPKHWLAGTVYNGTVANITTNSGSIGSAAVTFANGPVTFIVRAGVSFCSSEDAKKNMETEQFDPTEGTWISFDDSKRAVQDVWNSMLSRVSVTPPDDASAEQKNVMLTKLYTAVYHSFLAPTSYSEWDGKYLGFDWKIHHWKWWNSTQSSFPSCQLSKVNGRCAEDLIPESSYVSDLSLWDTHRTQAPWLTLAFPERAKDTVESLVTMTNQGGHLPRWPFANIYTYCMIASHGVIIMTDTLTKLCPDNTSSSCPFDRQAVFKCAKDAVFADDSRDRFDELHFVPAEADQRGASVTLARAYDADIVGNLASYVGEQNISSLLKARGQYYRNVWSNSSLAFCGTYANGTTVCTPNEWVPYPWAHNYTEGNIWQWRWFVPHDVDGLISLFPDRQTYVDMLTKFFNSSFDWFMVNSFPNPYYWAGNEPDLLTVWQFCWAGNEYAWLTQKFSRKLIEFQYNTTADGVPGNDDYGTMSSWLIWAMAGIYPVTGTGQYVLGSPSFSEFTLTLPSHSGVSVLNIISHNSSVNNVYVSKVLLNGTELSTPFVSHSRLVGSVLEFFMTDIPTTFGALATSNTM